MNETTTVLERPAVRANKEPESFPGLSTEAAVRQRELYGSNTFTEKKKPGFFKKFLMNLNDPIIRILIGALIINTVFMFRDINWLETGGIAVTIFLSAFVSTVSEHTSGAAFERLYSCLNDKSYSVARDGGWGTLPIGELVCGDVVRLLPGDIVPADGVMLQGSCTVDESALTGESRSVQKEADPRKTEKLRRMTGGEKLPMGTANALFRGSSVVSGEGVLLVTHVGDNTHYGAVAAELQDSDVPSPLRERLTRLAGTISKIGYASALAIALIHLFDAFFLDAGMNPVVALERLKDTRFVASECLSAVTMAISVIVVAVPEGLPMMITVVLSSNMKKMMRNNVLVKRLVGIETAGSVSILFTDKTGTLTTGQLKVKEVVTAERRYTSVGELRETPRDYGLLRSGARACSGGRNGTDRAILAFLSMEEVPSGPKKEQIPFDSKRKYAAAVVEDGCFVIRGAPEYLMPQVRYYLDSAGVEHPMTEEVRRDILGKITEMAKKSCRILLQAVGDQGDFGRLKKEGPAGVTLTFHALFVLADGIRENVPKAVAECRSAGIHTIMITGDNELTAAAIGVETGILSRNHSFFIPGKKEREEKNDLVVTGRVLQTMSDEEIGVLLPRIAVISRVTPTDKSRLVKIAQGAGHVVGMTGDGINDAAALKAADVGFAMGSGTDVAKEAGDIIITDDNFVSITKAVLFGRTIFESIRKFIIFQLTMNLSAVGVSLLGPLFGVDHPVTVIQMLWVNIIMDTLGSLAFAGEAALPEYMNRPPVKRSEPLLTAAMVRQIVYSGLYTIGLCVFFLVSPRIQALFGHGESIHFLTVFFALFIFLGICTAFNTRTPRVNLLAHLSKNKAFLVIMPAVAVIQLLIIYLGGEAFRTVPLSTRELLLTGLFSFTIVPADMMRKLLSGRASSAGQE